MFKSKRIGGCEREEEVFRVFQEKIEDNAATIEKLITSDHASTQFLMTTLTNC
jgi:hypothetical protein